MCWQSKKSSFMSQVTRRVSERKVETASESIEPNPKALVENYFWVVQKMATSFPGDAYKQFTDLISLENRTKAKRRRDRNISSCLSIQIVNRLK